MEGFIGDSESGNNYRSPAERRKFLEELRTQLPPAGPMLEKGGSPIERLIALLVEFLRRMLGGKSASYNILKCHPTFIGRKFNFAGTWCKRLELQWKTVDGKKCFPSTGANILKLIHKLNEIAPEELQKVAIDVGLSVDNLIDLAKVKFQDESFEDRDEFMEFPEDFSMEDFADSDSLYSEIERMWKLSGSTPCASSIDSDCELPSDENPIPIPSNGLTVNWRSDGFSSIQVLDLPDYCDSEHDSNSPLCEDQEESSEKLTRLIIEKILASSNPSDGSVPESSGIPLADHSQSSGDSGWDEPDLPGSFLLLPPS